MASLADGCKWITTTMHINSTYSTDMRLFCLSKPQAFLEVTMTHDMMLMAHAMPHTAQWLDSRAVRECGDNASHV